MARKLRVEYAGAIYHVMSRGDRREAIFRDDQDRYDFLKTLGEVCEKAGCRMGVRQVNMYMRRSDDLPPRGNFAT